MTDMQTRLREAMRAEAEQARPDELRPLRPLPVKVARRRAVWHGTARGWLVPEKVAGQRAAARGWLVPAATAMAIVAVIALVTVGVHATSGSRTGTGRTTQTPGQSLPGAKAVGRPPYFVTFASGGASRLSTQIQEPLSAVLHSSATGNALASARLPTTASVNDAFPVITASGDDRHFVVAIPTGAGSVPVTRFLVLTVQSGGRQLTVSPLSARVPAVPWYMIVTGLALSADGGELAVTWAAGPVLRTAPRVTGLVQVINMTTGTTRSWSTAEGNPRFNDANRITDPSWGTGDQVLGFLWDAVYGNDLGSGYYLLDVGNPKASLLSHKIINGWNGRQMIYFAALGGPAQTVIASVILPTGTHPQPDDSGYPAIVEYSARTGRELRTLYGPAHEDGQYVLYAVDPTGQHVLITTPQLTRIDHGAATRLAATDNLYPDAAW
jgi:hypothetical protein